MTLPTITSALATGGAGGFAAVIAATVGWPAARVLARLITGVGDIGVARVERPAVLIRAATEEIVKDRAALAELSRDAGVADPERLSRALYRLAHDQDRRQGNREAVAQKALENLATNPPGEGEAIVSEDFMSAFEPLAESATTEDAQTLFAKVLAGECRSPGSFSKATLSFLNSMDQQLAAEIETFAGLAFGLSCEPQYLPGGKPFTNGRKLLTLRLLEAHGLLFTGVNNPFKVSGEERRFFFQDRVVIPEFSGIIGYAPLTPIGSQVFKLVWRPPSEEDMRTIVQWLKQTKLTAAYIRMGRQNYPPVNGGTMLIGPRVQIFPEPTAPSLDPLGRFTDESLGAGLTTRPPDV